MAKPLMIQLADDSMIEDLKKKTGAKTKIDVVRQALNLLKADVVRRERIKRWRKAAKIVGSSGLKVLREFQYARSFQETAVILPKRWHVYIVDLEPKVGTKPGKQRPCLCIQPTEFCEAGLGSSLIIPLTTSLQAEDTFPLRIRIPKGICGLSQESEALIEQILAWDITLFKRDLGEIPEGLQELIKTAIRDILDL